jgi:hypothetical protein
MSDDMLLAGLATGDSHLALAVVRQSQRTAFDVALAVIGDLRLGSPVVIYFRSDDDVASVSSTVRRELIRGDGSAVPIGTLWLDKGYGGEEGPSSSTVTR